MRCGQIYLFINFFEIRISPQGCLSDIIFFMEPRKYFGWASILSIGGVLFAGYLSSLKLFAGVCAFGEPCPYFLGYPACYFGFLFFLTMAVTSLLGYFNKPTKKRVEANLSISLAGTIFAGYFVGQEILVAIRSGKIILYGLGLPTCVYGLIFYLIILVLSYKQLSKK